MKPLVSIILPFYNAATTLRRALVSIQNQSLNSFECILIDNNSTDNSRSIALEFSTTDSRFILTEERKQGVAYASNKGSLLARAEFIARMDADDESTPNRLLTQYNFLKEHSDYGAVSGLVEFIAYTNNSRGFAQYVDWVNSVFTYHDIYLKRFIELPIVNPSTMWRKTIAQKYGIYRHGLFPEDYEMWLRWLDHGVKIAKVNTLVLRWYDSENRLTRKGDNYSIEAFYKIKSKFLYHYLKEKDVVFPKVAIWGAGKIARKRAQLLIPFGIEICCYIDISHKRHLKEQVIYYRDILPKEEMYILVYVKQQEMREQVEAFLKSRDYVEGENYLLVS